MIDDDQISYPESSEDIGEDDVMDFLGDEEEEDFEEEDEEAF
jgi:hypothetical protein